MTGEDSRTASREARLSAGAEDGADRRADLARALNPATR